MNITYGVIGLGFGKNYVRLLQGSSVITATRDAERVIDNPGVGAVIIATPPNTHYGYIKRALKSGKDVLVEKPALLSVEDAEEIKGLIGSNIFMIAHQYLYNDSLTSLIKQIHDGKIGKLIRIEMVHYFTRVRQDIDVFWDAAPHEFAVLDLINTGRITNVYGRLEKGHVALDIKFENVHVRLDLSNNSPKLHKWTFIGDKGSLDFVDAPSVEPLRAELNHFISCVQKGRVPLTDIEHGIRVTKNMEQVFNAIA